MSEFLSAKALIKLSKEDIIVHTMQLQSSLTEMEKKETNLNVILERMLVFEKEVSSLKASLRKVKNDNAELRDCVYDLEDFAEGADDHFDQLAVEGNKLNQYQRRPNIEILNVPSNCDNNRLEDCAIAVLAKMDVKIEKRNIQSCHWLLPDKSNHKNLICRFTNSKIAFDCHKNKKKLIGSAASLGFDKGSMIIENLCPAFKKIYEECKLMKRHGNIFKHWSFNGAVQVLVTEFSRPLKIFSIDDLYDAVDSGW